MDSSLKLFWLVNFKGRKRQNTEGSTFKPHVENWAIIFKISFIFNLN